MENDKSPPRRRVHLLIRGRVQGVFFRASMQREARSHGVTGWVRNTFEGHVEAEVQGHPDAVHAGLVWSREGPTFARVDAVEERELDPVGGEQGFSIRR